MEICIVGIEIIPPFTGGLVNNVIRLAKGMTKRGHNVRIVTSDLKNTLQNKVTSYEGFDIHPIRIKGNYGSIRGNLEFVLRVIPMIMKEHSSRKIDILHFHSGYPIFGLIPCIIRNIVHTKMIFSLYSPIQLKRLNDRKGIYQKLSVKSISRFLLSRSGKITCTSSNIKESLLRLGVENISIVPLLVDINIFNSSLPRDEKREELGLSKSCPTVLYCGSWTKWKGVEYLIGAIHELIGDFPNIKLITAWGEPYNWYDDRKCMISGMIENYNMEGNVIELGIVEDMHMLMSACDIFVAPFINIDGIADPPLSVLEAMACGRPVVATNIGSIPTLFKNGDLGIVVEPKNVLELKNAIMYMLKNENIRKNMGINSSIYVHKIYGSESISSMFEEIYHKEIRTNCGNS